MAIGDPYVSMAEMKDYLKITTQTGQDEQIEDAIATASREIESHCSRQFNKVTVATAREFTPDARRWTTVDDFHTITDLVVKLDTGGDGTFATTLTSADYELFPTNGVVDGVPGWPFSSIRLLNRDFPCPYLGREAVLQITAQWGWAAVPAPVKSACKIIAAETWKLKDAPFGVLGLDEFGVVRVRQNKMAASKLAPYSNSRLLIG